LAINRWTARSIEKEEAMRKEVFYYSDGLKISAYLYIPDDWKPGDRPRPAVICITGYSGRKRSCHHRCA